jgi:phospholipid/cholesterol/gamma-HCH transport system substrate-binding protein
METRARYVLVGLFTLAIIVGGFGFVYWLSNADGLGERSVYRVRFGAPVSGLSLGSDVLFNGIRVGEVTDLKLDRDKPSDVVAMIAVKADTPIRSDTRVGLSYGGLTGSASIALQGGAASAPPLQGENGAPPLLVAAADATQDWTGAARQAFGQVSDVLSQNSDALHDTIQNIDSFAAALGRNSGKVDNLVAGLEKWIGNAAAPPATIYELTAPASFPAGLEVPKGQLVVAQPTVVVSLDTQRFLAGTETSENLVFDDAKWSDSIPNLVRQKIIEGFGNADYQGTGGDMQNITADRTLEIDIRAFRITTGATPEADVELAAKIVGSDGKVLGGRIFHATAPATAMQAPAAAAAMNDAFTKVATELIVWAMQLP